MKNIVRILFIILCVTFFSNEMNAQKIVFLEHQKTYDTVSGERYPDGRQSYVVHIFDDYIEVEGNKSSRMKYNDDGSISYYGIWPGDLKFTCYGKYWYVDQTLHFPIGILFLRSVYRVSED